MDNQDLLPCPFCSSDKVGIEGFVGATVVECYNCGVKGSQSENPSRAAIAWNRRASSAASISVSVDYPQCRHVAPIKHIHRGVDRIDILVEGLAAPSAAPASAPGWVMVPEVPTEDMVLATRVPGMSEPSWNDYSKKRHAKLYAQMLAARPAAPAPTQPEPAAQDKRDAERWRAVMAAANAEPCECPCLRDSLADWLNDRFSSGTEGEKE